MNYVIHCSWDDETHVWIATSDDVPGLVLESGSLDVLLERDKYAVPGLLELNNLSSKPITLTYLSERQDRLSPGIER